MPKLREVIGVAKTKIYLSQMRPRRSTDRQIGSMFGNQAKLLNYSEKKNVFRTNLEQMFKSTPRYTADNK